MDFPVESGTYVLILRCDRAVRLPVGRLGEQRFRRGYYLYVGSAFGPGGLRARLRHHLNASGRLHWHIDYLRRQLPLIEIWFHRGEVRLEDEWARVLAQMPATGIPVPGFGASDRRGDSHLFYQPRRPRLKHFLGALEAAEALVPVSRSGRQN